MSTATDHLILEATRLIAQLDTTLALYGEATESQRSRLCADSARKCLGSAACYVVLAERHEGEVEA